jgi:hypothetical protein
MPTWDIAVPTRPSRIAGVSMAGFSDRANDIVDVELVPHPAVMVIFNLGGEPFVVEDASGRRLRGRVVAGLAPDGAGGRGLTGSFGCLQVRLSPAVAHAVLGASAELGGTVTALDDLWGRDAERIEERLRAAGSWAERFAIAEAAVTRRLDAGPPGRLARAAHRAGGPVNPADRITAPARFCGRRDLATLDRVRADVVVLFGGSPARSSAGRGTRRA